ncbi:DEAD/DEAH box helicase [Thermus filiformis]|uniref:DEAD/DEAH box helicase n=1 Tax=Thermus filiformis TaxID=276 RepID=UPI001269D666|nr:AAA domain-containing protein [Thermus filiformis]
MERDLLEDRLNALVAHVALGEETLGEGEIAFEEEGEKLRVLVGEGDKKTDKGFVLQEIRDKPWSGDPKVDDREEGELVARFFQRLVKAIQEEGETWELMGVLGNEEAQQEGFYPLHLYVWSSREVKDLVAAVLRSGDKAGPLLEALWHLLGCRESLEQLIYSSLQEEVQTRYAVGSTSQGLIAVTRLLWPRGKGNKPAPFLWKANWKANGLDFRWLFRPWHFDFVAKEEVNGQSYYPEIRSRHYDALPPVYWRAFWKVPLPENDSVKGLMNGVRQAAPHLPLYLATRVVALRWLEEPIPKNKQIRKPLLSLAALPDFRLQDRGVVGAALDFLRFEHHVRFSNWLADKTLSPKLRVLNGMALLLERIHFEEILEEGSRFPKTRITAQIHLPQGMTLRDLEARFTLGEGDFVRLSPVDSPDRQKLTSPLYEGVTAILEKLDWEKGEVELQLVPNLYADRYVLSSVRPDNPWSLAVMDSSPSDYVARRVDARLSQVLGSSGHGPHRMDAFLGEAQEKGRLVNAFFEPAHPQIPRLSPEPEIEQRARALLDQMGDLLNDTQKRAILEGLSTRVHLLQGPPGTGKTQATAVALLLWLQLFRAPMIVAASTHTAVDTLLDRVHGLMSDVRSAFERARLGWVELRLVRLEAKEEGKKKDNQEGGQEVKQENPKKGLPVFFGTTNALLKNLDLASVPLLLVDEASMMPFPHFLALATLLDLKGDRWRVMLTGDHRQLPPIIQHQWEEEDRPGVQRYLPYLSAFEALLCIADEALLCIAEKLKDPYCVTLSRLDHTHRLPAEVRHLIQPLYHRDGVSLKGREGLGGKPQGKVSLWEAVWKGGEGVYLLVHEEDSSRKRNPLEAELIARVLEAAPDLLPEDVAVVTPFRAHRTLLRERLRGKVDLVDTVERLQGGERRVIFYSACASDPAGLMELQEFLLDVNRTNVAFSRAKEKLVVVVSENLLGYIPQEREAYEDAVLWKTLRELCREEVAREEVAWGGRRYGVRLLVPGKEEADA